MDNTVDLGRLPAPKLIDQLHEKPENVDLLDEFSRRILDDDQFEDIFEAFAKREEREERPLTPPLWVDPRTWQNCNGTQYCHTEDIRKVKNCADLVQAVTDGRAKNWPVRAVGSGHSFSAVAVTNGLLLLPQQMNRPLKVEKSSLRDESIASNLVCVESGMEIKDLNTYLDGIGKALPTLGAYDGQTIAGAISTGTHGSMHRYGPLANLVRSLVIVTETGTVYQVEPSNGITDHEKFVPGELKKVLQQNDDWFQSILVAMGCMGIIYSYTLEVRDAFKLQETRTLTTWQQLKSELKQGLGSDLFKNNDYFEIDINPYSINNENAAIKVTRNEVAQGTPDSGKRSIVSSIAGALASLPIISWVLVKQFNWLPHTTPATITRALKTLADTDFIRKSYKILILGSVNRLKAYGLELAFDCRGDFTKIIDDVIETFQKAQREKGWYIVAPIGLRFVSPASALLAPQQGRPTMMVELDMLDGVNHGEELLKYAKDTLYTLYPDKMRVHWGLDLDTMNNKQAEEMYHEAEAWQRWYGVYKELNKTGMWNNKFTDNMKISENI